MELFGFSSYGYALLEFPDDNEYYNNDYNNANSNLLLLLFLQVLYGNTETVLAQSMYQTTFISVSLVLKQGKLLLKSWVKLLEVSQALSRT